ncbi:amino acid ABC transporter substrate-binding protein [Devosia sp.]|uniref:amino acid ABC transporter substrate-binding protein n=1 Tax=Devosia sp. TaxID=1871048 RepID=UPI002FCA45E0
MMARGWITKACLGALLMLAPLATASAQAPVSTLDRIVETGTLRIGYSPDSAPFSYLDADNSIIGYSIDLCGRVAELLQRQLGLAELDIAYVRRTPSDRVALLKNGDIDIECVASTNNAERRNSVAFSYPHFMTAVQFVALKAGGLSALADLKGRTVTSTSGTTVIGSLNAVSRERNLNIAVMSTPDHETGFDLMATGRVSAFVMDGILLAAMAANAEDPGLFMLSSDALGPPEPYGLMLRHDDAPFTDAVNAALLEIFTQGEIGAIYEKWFTMPIPPHGVNLHFPMSDALAAAFAAPAVVGD